MKIIVRIALGILCGALALSMWAAAGKGAARGNLPLVVSPKVIQTKCTTCNNVTLHADVPYVALDLGTLTFHIDDELVSDKLAFSTWADDCGDLVIQFDFDEVQTFLPEPGIYDFTLRVDCLDGTAFDQTVAVTVR